MQHWIVEGFEGDLVRLEWQEKLLDFPKHLCPDVQVGDVLELQHDEGWFRFVVHVAETRRIQAEAEAALQDLNRGAPGGDIEI